MGRRVTKKKMSQQFGEGSLPVVFFREGKQIIAYSHALDLSTCGKTFEEARSRFIEAASLFLKELVEMGTLEEVLEELGWKKSRGPSPHWVPPQVIGHSQESVRIPVPLAS